MRQIQDQQILISFSQSCKREAECLALSIYYMRQHFTQFAGTCYTPLRGGVSVMSPTAQQRTIPAGYAGLFERADICIYIHEEEGESLSKLCYESDWARPLSSQKKRLLFHPQSNRELSACSSLSQQVHFRAHFANKHHLLYLAMEQLWLLAALPLQQGLQLSHDEHSLTFNEGMQLQLDSIPFIKNNVSYAQKLHRLTELLADEQRAQQYCQKYPSDKRFRQQLSSAKSEITQVRKEIKEELDLILHYSLHFARLRTQQLTARMERAHRYFDRGEIESALAQLDEVEQDARDALHAYRQEGELYEAQLETLRVQVAELSLLLEFCYRRTRSLHAQDHKQIVGWYSLLLECMQLAQMGEEEIQDAKRKYNHFIANN